MPKTTVLLYLPDWWFPEDCFESPQAKVDFEIAMTKKLFECQIGMNIIPEAGMLLDLPEYLDHLSGVFTDEEIELIDKMEGEWIISKVKIHPRGFILTILSEDAHIEEKAMMEAYFQMAVEEHKENIELFAIISEYEGGNK